jgi:hypothetical protein
MQGRYCKKILRLPPSTVNGAAMYELGTESRRQQLVFRISKFWCRMLQVEQKLLKCCYYWQIVNLKWENWVGSLREELYETGLEYFWGKWTGM